MGRVSVKIARVQEQGLESMFYARKSDSERRKKPKMKFQFVFVKGVGNNE